jgi:hypothetical protein
MRLPLGTSDFSRSVAQTPDIRLLNRYFEQCPVNQKDQVALLTRPALRKWLTMTHSPIRQVYSQPGTFGESLFVVGGNTVYKIAQDETVTVVGTIDSSTGAVSMAATDTYLFIADGLALHYYTESDYARGTLTSTGAIADNDTVTVGSMTYKFTSGDVDTGTPAGTLAQPWLVSLSGSVEQALANLLNAINNSGAAGVDYSSSMAGNPDARAISSDATTLVIRAFLNGADGDTVTTTETGANIAWGGATLSGGGGSTFSTVAVPDNDGIVSVGVIASFTICVVAQGQGKNGRFYWIEPGEIIIDPLNFATAERSPDPVWQVVVVGDQFWLPGTSTNEVWYPSGDALAPFQRQQGRLFDKGIWEGTIVQVKDDVMAVGTDGTVYRIGAEPVVVSTPGIAERLREAINAQRIG